MSHPNLELEHLRSLLRRPVEDPELLALIRRVEDVKRSAYYGTCELKERGVSLVFREAPWVLPTFPEAKRKTLFFSAAHFHRALHEGFAEYQGRFPNDCAFGDTEEAVVGKLGTPAVTGGGGTSQTLGRPIPRWLRYALGDEFFHLQFDPHGQVEMTTIFAPDPRQH